MVNFTERPCGRPLSDQNMKGRFWPVACLHWLAMDLTFTTKLDRANVSLQGSHRKGAPGHEPPLTDDCYAVDATIASIGLPSPRPPTLRRYV